MEFGGRVEKHLVVRNILRIFVSNQDTVMKEEILKLRKEGKSYNQISRELDCSKGTVAYHCGEGQKEKSKIRSYFNKTKDGRVIYRKVYRLANFRRKIHDSLKSSQRQYTGKSSYSKEGREEFVKKCLKEPRCYWTGLPIDLNKPLTYELDHYIPLSKGGSNDFANIVLTSRIANRMKGDLKPKDFLEFVKLVHEHHGNMVPIV